MKLFPAPDGVINKNDYSFLFGDVFELRTGLSDPTCLLWVQAPLNRIVRTATPFTGTLIYDTLTFETVPTRISMGQSDLFGKVNNTQYTDNIYKYNGLSTVIKDILEISGCSAFCIDQNDHIYALNSVLNQDYLTVYKNMSTVILNQVYIGPASDIEFIKDKIWTTRNNEVKSFVVTSSIVQDFKTLAFNCQGITGTGSSKYLADTLNNRFIKYDNNWVIEDITDSYESVNCLTISDVTRFLSLNYAIEHTITFSQQEITRNLWQKPYNDIYFDQVARPNIIFADLQDTIEFYSEIRTPSQKASSLLVFGHELFHRIWRAVGGSNDTLISDEASNALVRISGQFSTTVKDSLTVGGFDPLAGIDTDNVNTMYSQTSGTPTMSIIQGVFDGTLLDSYVLASGDAVSCCYYGDDSAYVYSNVMVKMSGQFTSTVKDTVTIGVVDHTGIKKFGSNTMLAGNASYVYIYTGFTSVLASSHGFTGLYNDCHSIEVTAGDHIRNDRISSVLVKGSGQFTDTIKDSQLLNFGYNAWNIALLQSAGYLNPTFEFVMNDILVLEQSVNVSQQGFNQSTSSSITFSDNVAYSLERATLRDQIWFEQGLKVNIQRSTTSNNLIFNQTVAVRFSVRNVNITQSLGLTSTERENQRPQNISDTFTLDDTIRHNRVLPRFNPDDLTELELSQILDRIWIHQPTLTQTIKFRSEGDARNNADFEITESLSDTVTFTQSLYWQKPLQHGNLIFSQSVAYSLGTPVQQTITFTHSCTVDLAVKNMPITHTLTFQDSGLGYLWNRYLKDNHPWGVLV